MLKTIEAVFTPLFRSRSDDGIGGKLQPGYTEPLMAIDHVSRSAVQNCRQPAYFSELGTGRSTSCQNCPN